MFTQEDVFKACKYGSMVCRRDTAHRDGSVSKSFYYRNDVSSAGRIDYCLDKQNANKFKFAYFWMNAVAHEQGRNGNTFEPQDMIKSIEVLNSMERILLDSHGKGVSVQDIQNQLKQQLSTSKWVDVICNQFLYGGKESFESLLDFIGSRNGISFSNSHCRSGVLTFDIEMEKEEM